MSWEKVEHLVEYLNLCMELKLYPTKNEDKEEYYRKLKIQHDWEVKRELQKKFMKSLTYQNKNSQAYKDKQSQLANLKQVKREVNAQIGTNNLNRNFGNTSENFNKAKMS
mmetsp:Transcript_27593/g.26624  ORF Transcript_27593/g.26624 Transcript_27593/m.26624 type:complete len:110 (+) Transcript_27593:368-697(+)